MRKRLFEQNRVCNLSYFDTVWNIIGLLKEIVDLCAFFDKIKERTLEILFEKSSAHVSAKSSNWLNFSQKILYYSYFVNWILKVWKVSSYLHVLLCFTLPLLKMQPFSRIAKALALRAKKLICSRPAFVSNIRKRKRCTNLSKCCSNEQVVPPK